ncbi:hypothetical protein [Caballeronia sp. S22]|uniref:hypothetical protein n=1 Tax=Caballeronia sp. S22 TaxID=3137182 RepID=UPI003530BBD6
MQIEPEFANRVVRVFIVGTRRRDERFADAEMFDASAAHRIDESGRRRTEQSTLPRGGHIEHAAVFRDDARKAIDAIAQAKQIVELAAGHERDLTP